MEPRHGPNRDPEEEARTTTDMNVLRRCAQDTNLWIVIKALENPSVTPEILRLAMGSPFESVPRMVARHKKAPPDLLDKMAQGATTHYLTREAVAGNLNTSVETLLRLLGDEDKDVRAAALDNLERRGILGLMAED